MHRFRLIEFLRSLTLGGLFGASVGGTIFILLILLAGLAPNVFIYFVTIGAVWGAAFHRLIDQITKNRFLKETLSPLEEPINFDIAMREIDALEGISLLDSDSAHLIQRILALRRYLGKEESKQLTSLILQVRQQEKLKRKGDLESRL